MHYKELSELFFDQLCQKQFVFLSFMYFQHVTATLLAPSERRVTLPPVSAPVKMVL